MADDRAGWVSYHLHKALAYEDPPGRRYAADYVHASDVTNAREEFCPRQWALYDLTGERSRAKSVAAADSYTYRLGYQYQDLARRLLGSMVVGDWVCRACRYTADFCRRPERCGWCGVCTWRYQEVRFLSAASGMSCGVDLLVRLPGNPRLTVVEVKSMQKADFKDLLMPMAEHRLRTALYLRIVSESSDHVKRAVDVSSARILYMVKGGWGQRVKGRRWRIPHDGLWSPFKEFVVERADETTDPYHAKARALHEFRTIGGPVPSGVCGTQFCGRAMSCTVATTCFSGLYPAGSRP